MKFGINAWVWTSPVTTEELEKLAPKVAEMGFDMIEIPLEDLSDLDFKRGAEIIRECGLGVSGCAAMGPDRDLIHPDESVRQNGMAYLKGAIDACATLGATNLVGPLYSAVGRTWQQAPEERAHDLDILVENLSELARYAEERGVRLGLEPLNRFETSFINLAAQAREVVDRVGHPNLGIMLDTFHMNIEEKRFDTAIRTAGDRLYHLHACGSDRGAPGSGTIKWDEVRDGLKAIGYDGPVVIESFTSKVKSISRAAAIWRDLEPSQDELAEKGLRFLRDLLA
ncbi:MAG TPA: sugar phosphate isomerase/epimerase family protein [Aggregatilineales bacterium]|nr:sugar phosphate isomerase/epimerase family protein [Aggregatilineales bacterium]HQA69129.1 sugar phosphate isomerase/epimerase family protein [Aggregatilineales bacterium]